VSERAVVTGAAGFIGSHLCEALVARGMEVVGVDCFTDYYDPAIKRANVAALVRAPRFRLVELDLSSADLAALPDARWVFHQAAQPGVRASWGAEFTEYTRHNVLATQRLLERYKGAPGLKRVVVASSSSVYGDAEKMPTGEGDLPKPFSPYGVTKLAAEHLALLYARNFGVPAVALRYFTVYGPRQRPDMGFNRFFTALLAGNEIPVYGDGEQTRDFTFVADAVAANLAAAEKGVDGRAYNIGGGSRVSVNHVLETIGNIAGRAPRIRHEAPQPGDPRDTGADIARARSDLGWTPHVQLADGLAQQYAWQKGGA
jgi:UDP-glucose 4-epimerase